MFCTASDSLSGVAQWLPLGFMQTILSQDSMSLYHAGIYAKKIQQTSIIKKIWI